MQRLKLPRDQFKPAWGALFGAVPVAWIFWEPFHTNADWRRWAVTGLAYVFFIALYTVYVIYWSRPRVVRIVLVGMFALAMSFTAYQFNGVSFFLFVAAIAPFAVPGKIWPAVGIILSAQLVLALEWWLFWASAPLPFVIVGMLSLLLGAGTTLAARQQTAVAHAHRVAERNRIARDLHDILGHTLTVIIVKAELAGRFAEVDAKRAQKEIGEIEGLARKALSEVREAISGYREGGLAQEFDRAKSIFNTSGVEAEYRYEPIDILAGHERVLALVLREAVTNIIRHARATRCKLALRQEGGRAVLQVQDNGRGGEFSEGMGMRGIRERIQAIGGTVGWETADGTKLTVTVPLGTDADGNNR